MFASTTDVVHLDFARVCGRFGGWLTPQFTVAVFAGLPTAGDERYQVFIGRTSSQRCAQVDALRSEQAGVEHTR
jgi:hypothetical protein